MRRPLFTMLALTSAVLFASPTVNAQPEPTAAQPTTTEAAAAQPTAPAPTAPAPTAVEPTATASPVALPPPHRLTPAEIEANAEKTRPRMRSEGMVVGGAFLITLGAAATVTSVVFFAEAAGCRGDFCGFNVAFGAGFVGLSALFLGIGIPLLVKGAKQVPPASIAATRPVVYLGPGSARLEWQF